MVGQQPTLHVGERIIFAGVKHEVVRVTPCSATINPLEPDTIELQDGRTVKRWGHPVTISPFSEVRGV